MNSDHVDARERDTPNYMYTRFHKISQISLHARTQLNTIKFSLISWSGNDDAGVVEVVHIGWLKIRVLES